MYLHSKCHGTAPTFIGVKGNRIVIYCSECRHTITYKTVKLCECGCEEAGGDKWSYYSGNKSAPTPVWCKVKDNVLVVEDAESRREVASFDLQEDLEPVGQIN